MTVSSVGLLSTVGGAGAGVGAGVAGTGVGVAVGSGVGVADGAAVGNGVGVAVGSGVGVGVGDTVGNGSTVGGGVTVSTAAEPRFLPPHAVSERANSKTMPSRTIRKCLISETLLEAFIDILLKLHLKASCAAKQPLGYERSPSRE